MKGDTDHPGCLAGLPMGIEDLTSVAGVRTTIGIAGFADHVPAVSEPPVERLGSRGGIVTGKNAMRKIGAGANTFNAVYGTTRNPWDTTLNRVLKKSVWKDVFPCAVA